MAPAALALTLCTGYLVVVLGVRTAVQLRATGTTGWVGGLGDGRAERAASILFLLALVLDLLGPLLVLAGRLQPFVRLDLTIAHAAGATLMVISTIVANRAQATMGNAWRTGVGRAVSSAPLVTRGLFSLVRNPVYATMVASSIGVALLVPTPVSPLAIALCLVALELQTRAVEEPHLLGIHGTAYLEYGHAVGRFLPSVGRFHRAG